MRWHSTCQGKYASIRFHTLCDRQTLEFSRRSILMRPPLRVTRISLEHNRQKNFAPAHDSRSLFGGARRFSCLRLMRCVSRNSNYFYFIEIGSDWPLLFVSLIRTGHAWTRTQFLHAVPIDVSLHRPLATGHHWISVANGSCAHPLPATFNVHSSVGPFDFGGLFVKRKPQGRRQQTLSFHLPSNAWLIAASRQTMSDKPLIVWCRNSCAGMTCVWCVCLPGSIFGRHKTIQSENTKRAYTPIQLIHSFMSPNSWE